jgi:uncharacterized protein (TIGR02466 family)
MGEFNLIFAPFYWKAHVEETADIINSCMGKIESNVRKAPIAIPTGWECSIHSSFRSNNPDMKLDSEYLASIYSKYIANFLHEYGLRPGKFNIESPWYNVFSKSQYQEPHTHLPAHFSVVHYVTFDESQHLATTFVHPNLILSQTMKAFCPPLRNRLDGDCPAHSLYMDFYTPPQIKEGDLIIFPSFLNHYVKPNTSEKQRITITFNVELE